MIARLLAALAVLPRLPRAIEELEQETAELTGRVQSLQQRVDALDLEATYRLPAAEVDR